MEKENNKETKKESVKKLFQFKDINPSKMSKLLIALGAGIALLILSFPNLFTHNSSKDNKSNSNSNSNSITSSNEVATAMTHDASEDYTTTLEVKLKDILGKVDGIGKVEVMITLKGSKELITLKDSPYTQESMNEVDGEGGSRISSSIIKEDTTVIVNNQNGGNVPYVIKEIEPEVAGVVVIAEGGDDGIIKTEITEAVQVLFNIPVHKIKVMKMNK